MEKSNILYSLILIFSFSFLFSQNTHTLDIDNCLNLLESNSEEFKMISRNIKIDSLRQLIFKNSLLPKANFDISIPTYNKSINSITLPNGNNSFIEQAQANTTFSIDIIQPISITGGDIIINSSLNRLDNLINKSNSTSLPHHFDSSISLNQKDKTSL